MAYLLEDLVINRVDLVDEGANSAAFIELYKRKETTDNMNIKEILSKMKPEHAAVIQAEIDKLSGDVEKANTDLQEATQQCAEAVKDLAKANEDLEKANGKIEALKAKQPCDCDGEADENGVCKSCGKPKKKAAFDEEETLKSMPAEVRAMFEKMRTQKEAAEEAVRKAKEAEQHAEAVAKAAELKSLPVDNEKLVGVIKRCDADMLDILTTINAAIDGVVLNEIGKNYSGTSDTSANAWSKIESKADEIAKRDSITKQKAISVVIKENPELYKEYLNGGMK